MIAASIIVAPVSPFRRAICRRIIAIATPRFRTELLLAL